MRSESDSRIARRPRPAFAVGAGIFLSRIAGYGRDVAIAAFLGTSLAADAYMAALRIPNILRNLLGEGALSASFVPVYSGALARNATADARRLAGTVLGLLLVLAAVLSGVGILLAPWLTRLVVPGWSDEAGALTLTTHLVRILFPMAGLMILAAWCLGVLNSHRRFFLSFSAPTLWNLAQIGGLLLAWRQGWEPLVVALAWSTLAGGALQFLVQLPAARRLAGQFRLSLQLRWEPVRLVLRNFGPVVLGAGVAQLSSFFDVFLASFLTHGAVAALYFAQRLYYLPLSLFGTSVAAASLPELSREAERQELAALRERLKRGFRGIVFASLPASVVFILFGDWIVGLLFQRGQFTREDTQIVHATLAAYSVGLVAASSVRLFASGFHAMLDTRTPVKYAATALAVGAGVGAALMWQLYAPGLAAGAAVGAWLYLSLLWRGLRRPLGPIFSTVDLVYLLKLLAACAAATGAALAVESALAPPVEALAGGLTRLVVAAGTLTAFGVVYLAISQVIRAIPPGGLSVWSDRGS